MNIDTDYLKEQIKENKLYLTVKLLIAAGFIFLLFVSLSATWWILYISLFVINAFTEWWLGEDRLPVTTLNGAARTISVFPFLLYFSYGSATIPNRKTNGWAVTLSITPFIHIAFLIPRKTKQ